MADSCTIAQEIVGKAGLVTLLFQRSVRYTNITDISPLARVPRLTTLDVRGTAIRDFSPLAALKPPLRVVVSEGAFTEAQADELRKTLPGCVVERN